MEWPDDDEEEYDEPVEVTPLPCADPAFREHLLALKHELYENVIYQPAEGTDAAQDIGRLQEYLKLLNRVYLACLDAQKGRSVTVDAFPPEIKVKVKALMDRIDGVREMPWEDRIPYERMVEQVFHEDPFVQN